jgi:alpha-L-fucosidase 2
MNKQLRRQFLIQIGGAGAAWALTSPALRSAPSEAAESFSDLAHHAAPERMSRYNVVWNNPSKDATGVMPIGNGDIAAGVYAIEDGDLYLLLAKNDAYNYMGDLYKTGRVRVSLDPNPFKGGKAFRQTLDLPSGSILIEADGVTLRIWTDANRPTYHLEISSPRKIAVTAQPEFWKRFDACISNVTDFYTQSSSLPPGAEPTQDVRLERDSKLLWYFPVGDRSVLPTI